MKNNLIVFGLIFTSLIGVGLVLNAEELRDELPQEKSDRKEKSVSSKYSLNTDACSWVKLENDRLQYDEKYITLEGWLYLRVKEQEIVKAVIYDSETSLDYGRPFKFVSLNNKDIQDIFLKAGIDEMYSLMDMHRSYITITGKMLSAPEGYPMLGEMENITRIVFGPYGEGRAFPAQERVEK